MIAYIDGAFRGSASERENMTGYEIRNQEATIAKANRQIEAIHRCIENAATMAYGD